MSWHHCCSQCNNTDRVILLWAPPQKTTAQKHSWSWNYYYFFLHGNHFHWFYVVSRFSLTEQLWNHSELLFSPHPPPFIKLYSRSPKKSVFILKRRKSGEMWSSTRKVPLQKFAEKGLLLLQNIFFFLFAHLNDVWFGIVRTWNPASIKDSPLQLHQTVPQILFSHTLTFLCMIFSGQPFEDNSSMPESRVTGTLRWLFGPCYLQHYLQKPPN